MDLFILKYLLFSFFGPNKKIIFFLYVYIGLNEEIYLFDFSLEKSDVFHDVMKKQLKEWRKWTWIIR